MLMLVIKFQLVKEGVIRFMTFFLFGKVDNKTLEKWIIKLWKSV
jgi:hypothetical protein